MTNRTYIEAEVPPDLRSIGAYLPTGLPDFGPVVITHPLDGQIPSQATVNLFPFGSGQAWEGEQLQVIGEETIAGRQAIILEVLRYFEESVDNRGVYWIDTETGVILKSEYYKAYYGMDRWVEQVMFTSVTYDSHLDNGLFTFEPGPDFTRLNSNEDE